MRRYLLVQLYLIWHTVVSFVFGTVLIAAPQRLVSGASTTAIYDKLNPPVWGVLFLVLAVVCAAGASHPATRWRYVVLVLFVCQVAWAIGLSIPVWQHLDSGEANALAPLAWITLAFTTAIIAVETINEEQHGSSSGRG